MTETLMSVQIDAKVCPYIESIPWTQDKFMAFGAALIRIGELEPVFMPREANYGADNEFNDKRISIVFATDERITPYFPEYGRAGTAVYRPGNMSMGPQLLELKGLIGGNSGVYAPLISTIEGTGYDIRHLSNLLARDEATLTLGLSSNYLNENSNND